MSDLIRPYSDDLAPIWDDFVLNRSVNGTFMQTRNFLNYHPKDRFEDSSLLVYNEKNRLVAVVPACRITDEGKPCFYSHRGASYGGIVVRNDAYTAERVISIVDALEEYWKEHDDQRVVLRITADIHAHQRSDLLQYVLTQHGFDNYCELNTYVDLTEFPEDVMARFDRNKVRNIRKCQEYGLTFRPLTQDRELEEFHKLLTINLSKYGVSPVHSVSEIIDLRVRIPDNIRFYGVFQHEAMMAGGMMYVYGDVIHAQYLSADFHFTEYSPITYLYYRVIQQAKDDGYRALSWGISTEDHGRVLNMGLIRNKESYGSKHMVNRTYWKNYT